MFRSLNYVISLSLQPQRHFHGNGHSWPSKSVVGQQIRMKPRCRKGTPIGIVGIGIQVEAKVHTFKTYECNICGAVYDKLRSFRIHKKRHYGKYQYKCSVCGRGFSTAIIWRDTCQRIPRQNPLSALFVAVTFHTSKTSKYI